MAKRVVKTTVSRKKKATKRAKKKVSRKARKKSSPIKTKRIANSSPELLSLTKRSFENLEKRDSLLIENFVGLQEAMTNLSKKFSELSQNLNNLLGVFELAAKTLAESEKQVDNTLSTKLDALIEQNKSIAREINIVDGKIRRKGIHPAPRPNVPQPLYAGQMKTLHTPAPARQTPQAPQAATIPPKQLPKI